MTTPPITNKQQEILILLYQFRFLNRLQIQAHLKHKDYKTINLWLKDLKDKEYIGRIYSTKVPESMKPAIYYLALNGIRYLKTIGYQQKELKPLYSEKERAENFIAKHVLLADIWLDLQNKSNDKTMWAAATASDLTDPDYKYHFLAELGPDLVFVKKTKNMNMYYLLEIFESKLPFYSIRKKIRNYFDFYFYNAWEDNTSEDFPTLLFVCPDLSTLISAKRYARKLLAEYDDIDMKMQFAENIKMQEAGVTGEIWEEVIIKADQTDSD